MRQTEDTAPLPPTSYLVPRTYNLTLLAVGFPFELAVRDTYE